MKITVINGTEKHGITYRMKELFLAPFRGKAAITEFYLPRDCNHFCTGCVGCVLRGEDTCKAAGQVQAIQQSLLEADLIVMTSPAYVMHTTGAMKAFLDHMAYRWMPHRPAPSMFQKRAVIITQCLGAGGKSAARDIRHSLSWWGISHIETVTGTLMSSMFWDELPEKKRAELTRKIQDCAARFAAIDYTKPAGVSLVTRGKFYFCRHIQTGLHRGDPDYRDGKYWADQGWLGKNRPWRG